MVEKEHPQEATKRFSRERFKKVMRRNPLTWQEGAIITMFAGAGAVYGAGYGYAETFKAIADGKELAKPLIEGLAFTIVGGGAGEALGKGTIAMNRGWGDVDEPVSDPHAAGMGTFRDFIKTNRGWIMRNAAGYGLPISAFAAGGLAIASGNNDLAEKLVFGGLFGEMIFTPHLLFSLPKFKKRK